MGFKAKIFLHILVVILVSCCVKAEEEKWETDEQSVEGAPEPPGRSEETPGYGETSQVPMDIETCFELIKCLISNFFT